MTGACKRWASRLGRLALRFAWDCLSTSGSGLWFFPPHSASPPRGAGPVAADELYAPAFDPDELDAWLAQVLGEAGTHD